MAFNFNTVPTIISAPGAIARLGELAKARLGARVLVVTDPVLVKLGIVERGLDSLRKAGVEARVFDAVEADPPEACVMAAVASATALDATGVVGLGGGSSLDVAKLVAKDGLYARLARLQFDVGAVALHDRSAAE